MALNLETIPFVKARWFTELPAAPVRKRRKIVLHTIECPERPTSAEECARYFATTDVKASAHYCVDSNSIIQCVQTKDVAYGAPGANHDGIQIEMAGRAAQGPIEWHDAYSQAMLTRTAELVAELCRRFEIPLQWLTWTWLLENPEAKGVTTHRAVAMAFRRSTHTDPGKDFPGAEFMSAVSRS